MIRLNPECPHCHRKEGIRKHGTSRTRLQRYMCIDCGKTFQTRYYYRANYHNINSQISELVRKGWSAQKIGIHLKISVNTVNRRLKDLLIHSDSLTD
ncbi:IS1 family transposase [Budviciaceae bacterium CWB-B4]|uniref:IS1 family transposase n=1 Tax=Limnobaculum xujianqingii TaxID=2738837 RepID=A0A9D7AFG9_9GAMM|nr:hypothetical protein [Limnobaculum xujianqingii]MBK5071763.1 IS1 family transposase [Limnobaculum xujianqingii]MBK5175072.1 IS1 family transposase [Limnobaculum xujianqingii]